MQFENGKKQTEIDLNIEIANAATTHRALCI